MNVLRVRMLLQEHHSLAEEELNNSMQRWHGSGMDQHRVVEIGVQPSAAHA
jgi:hypothetical protein